MWYSGVFVIGLIAFILWVVGVVWKGSLPANLVSAALVVWIICGTLLLVFGVMGQPRLFRGWRWR